MSDGRLRHSRKADEKQISLVRLLGTQSSDAQVGSARFLVRCPKGCCTGEGVRSPIYRVFSLP